MTRRERWVARIEGGGMMLPLSFHGVVGDKPANRGLTTKKRSNRLTLFCEESVSRSNITRKDS